MKRPPLALPLFVVIVAALLLGAGTQGTPISLLDALNRIRPGVARHSTIAVLDADTTTEYLTTHPASVSTIPACYPDRGTLVIDASAAATCCIALAPNNLTLGTQVATSDEGGLITDSNGPDGNGACHTFMSNGGTWHQTIDVASLRTNYGARTGVCSAAIAPSVAVTGFTVRPACRADTDCTTTAGAPAGTTCGSSPTQAEWDQSCAYVVCKALVANTRVAARFEH